RLGPEDLAQMRAHLRAQALRLREGPEVDAKLMDLRALYEPYAQAIARNLFISLPPWIRRDTICDNWRSGPWDRIIQAQGLGKIAAGLPERRAGIDEHF